MKTKVVPSLALGAIALFGTGCASQSGTEEDFGRSVRLMITNQTYDAAAASYPSQEAVTGGNADRLEKVMDTHGTNVGDPRSVARPLDVGNR